jgi:transcriptional regulator with XRE-family HTH domain
VKEVIGSNVKALIRARDADFDAACKRLGMKETQLKRVVAGKHAITMSTLQRIAHGYDVEPYQLLVPGLDPKNPQVLRALSAAELKLYAALEEARSGGTQ